MSDLQRDKFEAWAKSEDINTVKYGATGVYCYPDAHAAWIVWQAAIESVVVELPRNTEFAAWVSGDTIDGYKAAIGDVIDSLDKAGISHK